MLIIKELINNYNSIVDEDERILLQTERGNIKVWYKGKKIKEDQLYKILKMKDVKL